MYVESESSSQLIILEVVWSGLGNWLVISIKTCVISKIPQIRNKRENLLLKRTIFLIELVSLLLTFDIVKINNKSWCHTNSGSNFRSRLHRPGRQRPLLPKLSIVHLYTIDALGYRRTHRAKVSYRINSCFLYKLLIIILLWSKTLKESFRVQNQVVFFSIGYLKSHS